MGDNQGLSIISMRILLIRGGVGIDSTKKSKGMKRKEEKERFNDKGIKIFLSKLTDVEFRYLRLQESMANDARTLIKEFSLTKGDFCHLMQIEESQYQTYLNGGFPYTVMKMALLNAAYCRLSSEKNKREAEEKFTNIAKV